MVSCASCGSSQTLKSKSTNITFHVFPKNAYRRQAWINFLKNPGWEPKRASVLCSLHFEDKYFDRTSSLKVRLLPTALPTIQVERLKYVRSYNPVRKTRVDEDEQNLTEKEKLIELSGDISAVPGPSKHLRTPLTVSVNESLQDTSHKKLLERKITELQGNNLLKSMKIRSLQKVLWRQKKVITSLKAMIVQLKEKNLMFEEHENLLLEHFGANQDIIDRLSEKQKT